MWFTRGLSQGVPVNRTATMPYFATANFNAYQHVLPGGGVVVREKQQVPPLRFAFLNGSRSSGRNDKSELGIVVVSQV